MTVPDSERQFTLALPLEQLPPGSVVRCTVNETDILLCNLGREGIFAVRNRCSHMSKPLHGGRLVGHKISCPEHGAEFDIRNGEALSFPAVRPIKTYPVQVRDDGIYVSVAVEVAPANPNPWLTPWSGD